MINFMNSKERCVQCGEKIKTGAAEKRTKEGSKVCSDPCKDIWDEDAK